LNNSDVLKDFAEGFFCTTLEPSNQTIIVMRTNSLSIGCVLTIFFVAFALTGCTMEAANTKADPVIYVKTTKAAESGIMNTLNYVGVIEDKSSAALSFSSIGTIENIYVREGENVRKGQLLARINPTQADNMFKATESSLKQARDAYNRLKSVHDNGSLPEIQMVEIETKIQQAESAYNIAKKNLDDCSLYSPVSGVVGKLMSEVGENAVIGKPVLTITDISSVKVSFSVPENEISLIPANCRTLISVAALNNKQFTAESIEKNVIANQVSHTYPASLTILNKEKDLFPGMICNVTVNLSGKPNSIVIPVGLVQNTSSGQKFVWCAENGIAKKKLVTTGEIKGNGVEIRSGLSSGDDIITEGYQKISEGNKIYVR
jgi:RND family efflux transporter MFP subunit